ncbi:hypothetical protein FGO68_gene1889 [Halteria grandinella]|uniref:Casein kinase I n=1 Tax=Halteria grandinella TaxID=5974 RepID=A0A8J8NZX3_HALGN|nr:hypothetical protein FGO68_gene1889 [Halteria grandinella]
MGSGSFSTIYSAEDRLRREKVALKIEKPDKPKRVLMFEFDVLKQIQGLNHTPPVYEFVERGGAGQNFIVMKLLGKNLANQKKILGDSLTIDVAINYLLQMIDSIEEVHQRGFIHRDVKPSNFVIGKGLQKDKVYIVDFGLAKQHLSNGKPIPMRAQADFRGTISYASLNAHLKIELSRRDDLWSFYFVILEFLDENIPWKLTSMKDEVKDIKMRCLSHPEQFLWTTTTKFMPQVAEIFYHIKSLQYEDCPNYEFVRTKLREIKFFGMNKQYSQQYSSSLISQHFQENNQQATMQPGLSTTLGETLLFARPHGQQIHGLPVMSTIIGGAPSYKQTVPRVTSQAPHIIYQEGIEKPYRIVVEEKPQFMQKQQLTMPHQRSYYSQPQQVVPVSQNHQIIFASPSAEVIEIPYIPGQQVQIVQIQREPQERQRTIQVFQQPVSRRQQVHQEPAVTQVTHKLLGKRPQVREEIKNDHIFIKQVAPAQRLQKDDHILAIGDYLTDGPQQQVLRDKSGQILVKQVISPQPTTQLQVILPSDQGTSYITQKQMPVVIQQHVSSSSSSGHLFNPFRHPPYLEHPMMQQAEYNPAKPGNESIRTIVPQHHHSYQPYSRMRPIPAAQCLHMRRQSGG